MNKNRETIDICIDFDGTCVYHRYPDIGDPVPGALDTLKELQEAGHRLILFTMRSGSELQEAVDYLESYDIELFGININPTQTHWTQSPKAYGQVYIDDAALGCPLKMRQNEPRPFVDWDKVKTLLLNYNILLR